MLKISIVVTFLTATLVAVGLAQTETTTALPTTTAVPSTTLNTTTPTPTPTPGNTTTMNMTTPTPGNTTTMTTVTTPSNTTGNATTTPIPSTTSQTPRPTPCPVVKWNIRDENNETCMLVDFDDGIVAYEGENVTAVVSLPATVVVEISVCGEQSAAFTVRFQDAEYIWRLMLEFGSESNKYYIATIAVSISTLEDEPIDEDANSEDPFFHVRFGEYYTCNELSTTMGAFNVSFTSPKIQPFSRKTEDECGLGEEHRCGDPDPSNEPNVGLIVGCVFGGIAGVLVIGGLAYYFLVEKKKQTYDKM